MRRLIAWIYAAWFGLQVKTNEHHIADLENALSELLEAQKLLDFDIAECVSRLLAAQEVRDRINQRRGEYIDTTSADLIDRKIQEIYPDTLRSLAAALIKIAAESEARDMGKGYCPARETIRF